MREIEPGHDYLLQEYYDREASSEQLLTYFNRIGPGYPGNAESAHGGTNCQEVIRSIIKRVIYMDAQDPCPENKVIIGQQRASLYHFESRHARRKITLPQMVSAFTKWAQGDAKAIFRYHELPVEDIPACVTCGHWFCGEHKA